VTAPHCPYGNRGEEGKGGEGKLTVKKHGSGGRKQERNGFPCGNKVEEGGRRRGEVDRGETW